MKATYRSIARGALSVAALHLREAAMHLADAAFWFALSLRARREAAAQEHPRVNVWHAPGQEPRA